MDCYLEPLYFDPSDYERNEFYQRLSGVYFIMQAFDI